MKYLIIIFSIYLLSFSGCISHSGKKSNQPVKIIFDTDIGPDYDDVGALAFLHAMADSGKAEILATVASNKNELVVPSIDVINTYFGRPEIQTGSPKSAGASMGAAQHWADSITSKYPHSIKSTSEAQDAVAVYRKILDTQPDNSVTIVTVGFLTNLNNLLKSQPDKISSLSGRELVEKKVKKLVSMAGWFPKGKEFNIYIDSASSKFVFENWPGEIIFTGYEIGKDIKTGLKLIASGITNSPVKDVFRISIPLSQEDKYGRMSWDETAVLIAVYGAEKFFDTVKGTIKISSDGSNTWEDNPAGKHFYVVMKAPANEIADFIEARMMHTPIPHSSKNQPDEFRKISADILRDKIAGGWAGKMIGVTYGAPTEFHAEQKIFEDSIRWKPSDIKGSLWQDDLYVQLTFLMSMDRFGVNAPPKKFQEMFAKAGYHLWHANMQARKNYYDSIFAPLSGNPEYNFHADDIDFQIEADYIGFMCPGMPVKASAIADRIGHIMNYGDGVYGGVFVAALYSGAFFEKDINLIIENALKSIPQKSDYYKTIKDVIKLHDHYPDDWRSAWKELESKWGYVDICGAGDPFNIDAKLNGAYIVMGLLYGDGDPLKTLEISTRCGQDSDCNPSNAMAVLGVLKGFSNLPENMRKGIEAISDSTFINTNYSFNKAVESTYNYAIGFIKESGGTVSGKKLKIKVQAPIPPVIEVSFPDLVFDRSISVFDNDAIKRIGSWKNQEVTAGKKPSRIFSGKKGDELEFKFDGTGISITGNWVKDGGKADIYIDGTLHRTIDTYYFFSRQQHPDVSVWHAFGLKPGTHIVKLVVNGDKRPESTGTNVYVSNMLVFKTAPKKSDNYKYTFE
jgi:inosine-uridine nucleoside N-ribohydrolase